jgi:hypothetical protein
MINFLIGFGSGIAFTIIAGYAIAWVLENVHFGG